MNQHRRSERFWKILSISLLAFFVINQVTPGLFNKKGHEKESVTIIKTAEASEIYPMFSCPCCGQPLNKVDPCCGAMIEMIDFIDAEVSGGSSEEEVILSTAKEFGIDRLINKSDRIALREKLLALAPADAPKVELESDRRDLGKVSQSKGTVEADFKLTNSGKSDLVINNLSSSCGCTSAAVVYKGKVGPKFTMEGHGEENPKDWKVVINPGDSAILRVYYDPTVHPDLVGDVTRTVSIFSNDPVDFEKQVIITLEQIK